MEELKKVAKKIEKLEIQGATNVAIEGVKAFGKYITSLKETNLEIFFKKISKAIEILETARATEPCLRNGLTSGSNMEIGCIHAEQNLIINAARTQTSLVKSWVFLSTYPCMMCAKLLAQAGISRLFVLKNSYPVNEGIDFLRDHGVICVVTDVTSA